ncbi:hypothetical protein ACYSNO_04900 [Enterococcus sp. LJL98]
MKAKRAFKRGRIVSILIFSLVSVLLIVKQRYFGLIFSVGMLLYILWHLQRVEKLLDQVEDS